jgi:predicted alpha/beta superfamily hydrolase
MMQRLFIIILFSCSTAFAQSVRIQLVSLPGHHPTGSSIFLAGSFNQWNPADTAFKFQQDAGGQYFLQVNLPEGNHAYKITRGSWEKVECTGTGASIGNRQLNTATGREIKLSIAGWQDLLGAKEKVPTFSKQVSILDTAFYIPQLKRKRTIRIYLPADYAGSKKRFPVMYMHDGQNLFDDRTSYAGEWGVDEYLDSMVKRPCIVVAIDNGGSHRMNEYCPFDFDLGRVQAKKEKGEGMAYVSFIVNTLKPFIDKKLRTKKEKEHTFIAGSSMGGLISLYASLAFPKVFGGAGVFSPSIWICKKEILAFAKTKGSAMKSRLFFYCGKQESKEMVSDMLAVFEVLQKQSKSAMTVVIRDEGQHNEMTWRKELPGFFQWILRN